MNKVAKYWLIRNCRFAQADPLTELEIEKRIAAPSESVALLGSENVAVVGDFTPTINVEGYGPVNIKLTIQDVINSIKSFLTDSDRLVSNPELRQYKKAFDYITNVVVGNYGSGEFGHAISKQPHTIYINWEGMRLQVERAVNAQIQEFAAKYGVPPQFTDDVLERIRIKVAEQLFRWASSTVAHESRHARDFQDVLAQMIMTGKGDLAQATEGRAEGEEGLVQNLSVPV